jgi:hypothetical protein
LGHFFQTLGKILFNFLVTLGLSRQSSVSQLGSRTKATSQFYWFALIVDWQTINNKAIKMLLSILPMGEAQFASPLPSLFA